jgi:hypothetical protein
MQSIDALELRFKDGIMTDVLLLLQLSEECCAAWKAALMFDDCGAQAKKYEALYNRVSAAKQAKLALLMSMS